MLPGDKCTGEKIAKALRIHDFLSAPVILSRRNALSELRPTRATIGDF